MFIIYSLGSLSRFRRIVRYKPRAGPSIKHVTLFLANFDPLSLSHFVKHLGTPKKYVTHLGIPQFGSTKGRIKNPVQNLSQFFRFFVWLVLSGWNFDRSAFCQNTSVITQSSTSPSVSGFICRPMMKN